MRTRDASIHDPNVCDTRQARISGQAIGGTDVAEAHLTPTIWSILSAIPGVLALFGSAAWLGRVSARLATVERELHDLKDIKTEVATIAERTSNTADSVRGQAANLQKITDHLLDEGRTFAREIIRRDAKAATP